MTPLISADQRRQLLANGAATARGEQRDPFPVVKLYTPDAHATWLLAELDPGDGDTAFGLIDLGMGMPELSHVRLSVLADMRGPGNLAIARDLNFTPRRSLAEYAQLARADGSIND